MTQVSRNGFRFCRWTIALILWTSWFLRIPWLLFINLIVLVSSSYLTVKRSPLIRLYVSLFEKQPKQQIEVDEKGISFAQGLGAVIHVILLVLLYVVNPRVGWNVVFVIAIVKTAGAFGFCTGLKIYQLIHRHG